MNNRKSPPFCNCSLCRGEPQVDPKSYITAPTKPIEIYLEGYVLEKFEVGMVVVGIDRDAARLLVKVRP